MRVLVLTLAAAGAFAQERTLGVQCSCDPPGTHRPAGFNCAALCAPQSGGGDSFSAQMTMFNSIVTGMMDGIQQAHIQAMRGKLEQERIRREIEAESRRQRKARDEEFERRRKDARQRERRRLMEEKAEAEAQLKGPASAGAFSLKDDSPDVSAEPRLEAPKKSMLDDALALLRRAELAEAEADRAVARGGAPEPGSESLRTQARILDCSMGEVYQAAEAMGPGGREYAAELRRDMEDVKKRLPIGKPPGEGRGGVDLTLNHAEGGARLTTHVLVSLERETGNTLVDVAYSITRPGARERGGHSTALLNPSGSIERREAAPAVMKCLETGR